MNEKVQVSIICTAFNHEKYIRQCLNGFVMQKGITFEIIINDDASTDNTANIIREYEKKYPNLFKPIYQTENQYSRIDEVIRESIVPLINGKYVAICEGDDYWIDPYKLKKQFDALENNPDCLMCFHKVDVVDEKGISMGYSCPRENIPNSILPVGYICYCFDNTKYIHLNSVFLKATVYKQYKTELPRFKKVAPVGDVPLLLFFTSKGKIHYINEVMSHYRFMSIGSWSYQNYNSPEKEIRRREINRKMKEMFVEYNTFTNNKYYNCFQDEIKKLDLNEYWYCINHKDYKSLFNNFRYKELKEFGLEKKAIIKMKLQIWFPQLFDS